MSLSRGRRSGRIRGIGLTRTIAGEPVRLSPRWFLAYRSDYEPSTFAFLRTACRPGATALDVGAHVGVFTVLMSRLVGDAGLVLAFEPTTAVRRALERTVRLNGLRNVEVRAEAVAETGGVAPFHEICRAGATVANSLVPFPASDRTVPVEVVSLDGLVSQRALEIGCVKVDVEGAELRVLQGASSVIRDQRPPIHLAVHPRALVRAGGSLDQLWEHLAGYELRSRGHPITYDWFTRQDDLFDVCAVPSGRTPDGSDLGPPPTT